MIFKKKKKCTFCKGPASPGFQLNGKYICMNCAEFLYDGVEDFTQQSKNLELGVEKK